MFRPQSPHYIEEDRDCAGGVMALGDLVIIGAEFIKTCRRFIITRAGLTRPRVHNIRLR